MKKFIHIFIIVLLVAIGIFVYLNGTNNADLYPLQIQSSSDMHDLKVELAITPQEKALGLMHREHLKEGRGMLFPYENPSPLSFWMKNMLMSIDMIFIGEDELIKHITHSAPPCPPEEIHCPNYRSPVPVKYVLEVPDGYCKKNGIDLSDRVILPEDL
jgi:uncharacterized membrane protein (UPF0127 family)